MCYAPGEPAQDPQDDGEIQDEGVTAGVLNVTAEGPTSSGFVTVYPSGQPRPLASNLNTVGNGTVPNRVVVQVGTDGKVDIYIDVGTVHLIADIAGYYTGPSLRLVGRRTAQLNTRRVPDPST
jgi:hypothetical protein